MSKYDPLWKHVSEIDSPNVLISFDEAESVLGFPIDHSFLSFKKELLAYGWEVGKISLKSKTVEFRKN